ncbi:MAG: CRISPR-associated protein Csx19 [Candidatus Methanomethyliaceae archaeon]
MTGELKRMRFKLTPLRADNFVTDPKAWLEANAARNGKTWLLAYADNGVIWGELRDGALCTANDVFPALSPPLRATTLQQAHLFGANAEVRVWRTGKGFNACRLEDHPSDDDEALDQIYLLWGTGIKEQSKGFALVTEGRQGLAHAVPLPVSEADFSTEARIRTHPLRLRVRHYVAYDEASGWAFFPQSRLVELFVKGDLK